MHLMGCSGVGFPIQIQLRGLFFFQERNDDVEPCPAPTERLVVKPVSSSRTGSHREFAGPGAPYPEELRCHESFSNRCTETACLRARLSNEFRAFAAL